jgi:hypothetical protein
MGLDRPLTEPLPFSFPLSAPHLFRVQPCSSIHPVWLPLEKAALTRLLQVPPLPTLSGCKAQEDGFTLIKWLWAP